MTISKSIFMLFYQKPGIILDNVSVPEDCKQAQTMHQIIRHLSLSTNKLEYPPASKQHQINVFYSNTSLLLHWQMFRQNVL